MIHSKYMSHLTTQEPITIGILILAGGEGTRATSGDAAAPPKQYRLLAGETVISRCFRVFRDWDPSCVIVIVRHVNHSSLLNQAVPRPGANTYVTIGGTTRQSSSLNGLRFLAALPSPPSHVFIHDVVRPFISPPLLDRLKASLTAVDPQAGAILALPVVDTVKMTDSAGIITGTIGRREALWRAQTPQAFPLHTILELHEKAAAGCLGSDTAAITDDAALFERANMTVRAVRGDARNIKLTYPEDFPRAEAMLRQQQQQQQQQTDTCSVVMVPDVRVGHGYDVHRLVPGNEVVLCGVRVPHDQSLAGHSDADAALHALTDAVLATVGAGDIGVFFPDADPMLRGASSERFLRHAVGMVRDAGAVITHADVTLVCERPRIGAFRYAMREAVAGIMGVGVERVSLKASTNEEMGFVGRGEGLLAIATATAVFPFKVV